MSEIVYVHAREVLDSRGNPTVEVEVQLDSGVIGSAIVPSGASTGVHEALELRDGDKKRYGGKGVLKAVENVNDILADELIGMDAAEQVAIDEYMMRPGRHGKQEQAGRQRHPGREPGRGQGCGRRSGSAALSLSGRRRRTRTLPVPMMNILNGGKHAVNSTDFQEFMVMPVGATTFPRRPALGCRDLPEPQEGAARRRLQHQRRRRRRLCAQPGRQRQGRRGDPQGHREGRLQARARMSTLPLTRPSANSTTQRPASTTWRSKGAS